ncbi:MAG: hypothetical protein H6492_00475 [Candidatus Paracaedibacteraceae bacterium]|nr:hypothetical protein [Candidatus Paracaedibacteraceae bacterium]
MRNKLLATVFAVSAAPSLHASEFNTFEHNFSVTELQEIKAEEFRPLIGKESSTHTLNFTNLSHLTSPTLGNSIVLDLTGYASLLKEVTLPTTATNIKVPAGTKIKFVGDIKHLNLSKIRAGNRIHLDLTAVTGMDKTYDAAGRNAIPEAANHVHFPDNAKEISVPSHVQTAIAAGAEIGEIATANVHSNSASTAFDKGAAHELHSYIMHQLTQGKAVLDLKDTTLASDEQAIALISALAELPLHLKEKVRGILIKLEGGNLPEGSFTTEAGRITPNLTEVGLSAFEYLFIDLNETQENYEPVSVNVVGLPAEKIISMNPLLQHN